MSELVSMQPSSTSSLWERVKPKSPYLVAGVLALCIALIGVGILSVSPPFMPGDSPELEKFSIYSKMVVSYGSMICCIGTFTAILVAVAKVYKRYKDSQIREIEEGDEAITSSSVRTTLFALGLIIICLGISMVASSATIHESHAFSDLSNQSRAVEAAALSHSLTQGLRIAAVGGGIGAVGAIIKKIADIREARRTALARATVAADTRDEVGKV